MARAPRQFELAGVFASAITPRRADSQDPDVSGLLDLLDFLAGDAGKGSGVTGICLFDAAGEFLNYSFSERQRLVYLAVKRSRVPLIVGVSHSTLAGSLQLADEAIASGADGVILMPPYFFPYSPPEIEEFYLQFAKETGDAVPILIHNFPQLTSNIELELMRKLIDTGRFSGIADSSGDWPFFEQLLELRQARPFALFNGHDRTALQSLRAGANGVISSSACAVPELLAGLAQAVSAGDEQQADALNTRLPRACGSGGQISVSRSDQTRTGVARPEDRAASDAAGPRDRGSARRVFSLVCGVAAADESRHNEEGRQCVNSVSSATS